MPRRTANDLFADIATRDTGGRRAALIEPEPPLLPEKYVPASRTNARAAFRPSPKLDTPEKLQRALQRERKRMAPFLRDLAPPPSPGRSSRTLETADWRLETESDRRDFPATLAGAGDWERVRLPHYGGPVGRATAYYRTTFRVTRAMLNKEAIFVCFKGVDYQAHVFLNGAFLGSHEGFFSPFEFDFTAHARPGENVLVVKVENDANPIADGGSWGMEVDGDKIYASTGLGWDDPELGWHHCPPGMGICQPVRIEARPRLHLADLFVRPLPEENQAELWVEVFNCDTVNRPVALSVSIFGQNFRATVFRDRVFQPPQEAGPRLNCFRFAVEIPNPRTWDLDTPWLYQAQIALPNGDTICRSFGMRSFRMDTEDKPFGRFLLNGREIRLRGANTMGFEQQDVFRGDPDQLCDDILLAKLCHMNFWRLTQRPVETAVYEMCDRLGLLTQTDLPLFAHLPRRQFCETVRQAEEMERLVRGHPCNILVTYINEPFPPAWGDKRHRQCSRAELETFFRAADHVVHLANPDRVIKPADGDYDPPAPGLPDNHCYTCWYNGHGIDVGKLHKGFWQRVKPDWFYGCGEFGAEGLDPVEVMREHYPKAWLPQSREDETTWSPDRIEGAQTGRFHYCFFETPRTLADWVEASRCHQGWAARVMTEAFRRDRRMNSIAIHLFIDAWPSGWMKAIMDVERRPKPAYFAYREALTPLMTNIRTDRRAFIASEEMRFEFWVCNDTHEVPRGARLRYQLEVDGRVVFAQQTRARIDRCDSTFQGFLKLSPPDVDQRTRTVLRLALAGADGKILHDTAIDLTIFPPAPIDAPAPHIIVVGARNGKAARLARDLGCKVSFVPPAPRSPLPSPQHLLLIDDMARFEARRGAIEAAVKGGATAVFLELSAGEHAIAGTTVSVEAPAMGPRHFVSRDTGHPLVSGFEPDDFRLWHDPAADRIAPLLETCFRVEGWTSILTTGTGSDDLQDASAWTSAPAAAERRDGAGAWRICQVRLAGRTATNPVAALFARRLLGQGA